jgi:hypothetical protein
MLTRRLIAALCVSSLAAIGITFINTSYSTEAAQTCPPGYHAHDENPNLCVTNKHPEPYWEVVLRQREWMSARSAPFDRTAPGAYANALEQRKEVVRNPPKIKGVVGTWAPYGKGPLISNGEAYPSTNDLGLVKVAGRIDNFAYDAQNNRLFATKGTGGIWLSTNLGDSWSSIGETLPSQIIAAVAWAAPKNTRPGRLIALSGDPALGSYTYTGFGAFYSDNLGATWTKATGLPDGAPGFAVEVDPANTDIVYAATLVGLFRSTDGGASYTNVALPTGACAGIQGGTADRPECHLANVVTDVVIKHPGGVSLTLGGLTGTAGSPSAVLAVVGWHSNNRANPDGSVQSPNNGLYRSNTGAPGTFQKLAATGFAPQHRIGRVEIAAATGPLQDHNYVYAIVQDAVALNGGLEVLDGPEGVDIRDPRPIGPALPVLGAPLGALGGTNLQGVYVSPDFGSTWTLMADDNMIAKNPATGSALVVIGQAIGYEPGVQAWYNLFIAPDPTLQTPTGIPTRLVFGLEEVWQNEIVGQPLTGPTPFKVIGRYFSGERCMLLNLGQPECPTDRPPTQGNTTHPDQHAAIWIPDSQGGVTLAVGNDGGFYKQHAAPGQELNNGGWGEGNQHGFNTLLPYDVAMAKDGTAYAGLQDNGHLKITPDGQQFSIYGGDGTFAEVDPENSNIAYEATPGGTMRVTTDGGSTWRAMPPPITNARFVNPFEMDPSDANHLVTAGRQVAETTWGPNTGMEGSAWKVVYDLGTASKPGDATAVASATDPANTVSAIDVQGDAVYVAFCGRCNHINSSVPFKRGLATNVGGSAPPTRMTSNGWHMASAAGLPNRYIMGVAIDPFNPRTVYVALGGYSVRWIPPGTLHDANTNIGSGHLFVSTDAGETFRDISANLPDVPATSVVIRGKQLIVGTDLGVFASDVRGPSKFAVLGTGLPIVPISTMQLAPGNCNRLVAATYGRGIYTFDFAAAYEGACYSGGVGGAPLPNFHPADRMHSGVNAWWSGSQGLADSHMTMSMTLPADASKLTFWTWYDLEDGYDWAFALVSTDNGQTWTSLVTTSPDGSGTTAIDPIGSVGGALGGNKPHQHGLTGVSGSPPTFSGANPLAPVYSEQTADISLFAGRSVLLRFAYTSDPATDRANFYVDDVRVLTLNPLNPVFFSDDMETPGGWTAGGSPGFRRVTAATTQ